MLETLRKRFKGSISLWLAGVTFVATYFGLAGFLVFREHFIVEYDIFNPIMIWISFIVPLVVVVLHFWRRRRGEGIESEHWFPMLVLVSAAYAFVLGIAGYVFSLVFSTAFRNLTYDFVSGPFLLAAYGAILAYFVSESVLRFNRRHFSYLIVLEFLAGFFLAAVNTGDNYWWRGSICSLGMPINGHPLYFNFTLVLTGLLLILFAVYLKPTMAILVERKFLTVWRKRFLNVLYFTLSFMIVLTGIFPYGVSEAMNKFHIYTGDSIFVFFAIFLGFTWIIFKKFPTRFKWASYFILGVGVSLYPLHYQVGYLAYAEMELMMVAAMSTWFVFFVHTISTLADGD